MRVFSIVDEEMNEGEPSKTDIWKSKAPTDVAMETLPASHVVNTLLQVLISFLSHQSHVPLLTLYYIITPFDAFEI